MTDILVFPKMFEFYKFFSYFYKSPKYLVADCKKVDEKEYLFKVVSLQPDLGKSESESDPIEALTNISTLGLSAQPSKRKKKNRRQALVQSSLLEVSGRAAQRGEEESKQTRSEDYLSEAVNFYSMYTWRILLIDESDIGFYNIFSKLVVSDNRYFLIGSCGSGNEIDCFSKIFYVNEAFKGDRGVLNEKGEFSFDKRKLVSHRARIWDDCFPGQLKKLAIEDRLCCSTNFLNVNIIEDDFAECLFDMETYDFYDICKGKGIKNYACFRFVTDYVVPKGLTKETVDQLIDDTRRKFLSEEMYEQFLESTEGLTNSQKKKIFRLRLQIDFDFLVDLSEGHTAMPKCNVNEERVNFYFNHFRNIWCTKYLDSVQSSKVSTPVLLCYKCGAEGHKMRNCPHTVHVPNHTNTVCHNCKGVGHKARDCNKSCFNCGQMGHQAKRCPSFLVISHEGSPANSSTSATTSSTSTHDSSDSLKNKAI